MRNTSVEDSGYYYCELMVRGKEPIIEEVTKLNLQERYPRVKCSNFSMSNRHGLYPGVEVPENPFLAW